MKGVNIKVIPHDEHRYPTCGDYWYGRSGTWEIRVSKMSDWRYEFLVAIHELAEMAWCAQMGISVEDIDNFDIAYEQKRKKNDDSEPGDSHDAPYYWGHQCATVIERAAAVFLGVTWADYEREVINL